jgi:hypothetical protein
LSRCPHTILNRDLEVIKSETLNDEKPRSTFDNRLGIVYLILNLLSYLVIGIIHISLHWVVRSRFTP